MDISLYNYEFSFKKSSIYFVFSPVLRMCPDGPLCFVPRLQKAGTPLSAVCHPKKKSILLLQITRLLLTFKGKTGTLRKCG